MVKTHYNSFVPQTCGVGVFGIFRNGQVAGGEDIKDATCHGGAGWQMASFTNEEVHYDEYKETYDELKKRFKIIYQSPKRVNSRTGHSFVFCLYDARSKLGPVGRASHNAQFVWPF